MLRTRIVGLVLLALLLQTGSAKAQGAPATTAEPSIFARIPHDKRIRLDVDGARYEGPFERFAADTLWLRPTGSNESLPLPANSIDALWQHESSAGKGAVVGGILLGAAGLGLGLAIESDDYFDSESTNEPLVLCLGGAACGLLLGAVIGQFIPHWSLKYP
jgi:hypothetical protein